MYHSNLPIHTEKVHSTIKEPNRSQINEWRIATNEGENKNKPRQPPVAMPIIFNWYGRSRSVWGLQVNANTERWATDFADGVLKNSVLDSP